MKKYKRVIPVLLLLDEGFVKTINFRNPSYVGDPINIVKIFNEKEVDELTIIDIGKRAQGKDPDIELLSSIATECFMPLSYGGGVKNIQQAEKIFNIGYEKIIYSKPFYDDIDLVKQTAKLFGRQSAVTCFDVKKNIDGTYSSYSLNGTYKESNNALNDMLKAEEIGSGEIIVNFIDHDGTGKGYDYDFIEQASEKLSIPLISIGGSSGKNDFVKAFEAGSHAVGAGSCFIYYGPLRAVLISYVTEKEHENINKI